MFTTLFWFTIVYLVAVNLLAFLLFRLDKQAAIADQWRIPERQLLMAAFVGGSIGARAGQVLLRHKTRKQPFRNQLNAIIFLQLAAIVIGLLVMNTPALRNRVYEAFARTFVTTPNRPHVTVHRGL